MSMTATRSPFRTAQVQQGIGEAVHSFAELGIGEPLFLVHHGELSSILSDRPLQEVGNQQRYVHNLLTG